MPRELDLLEETLDHFKEGAKKVIAFSPDKTFIITRISGGEGYWVAIEEQGFERKKAERLDDVFKEVFGIEATY
jgi:hypothetical protein